jgi:hypothetical protein
VTRQLEQSGFSVVDTWSGAQKWSARGLVAATVSCARARGRGTALLTPHTLVAVLAQLNESIALTKLRGFQGAMSNYAAGSSF